MTFKPASAEVPSPHAYPLLLKSLLVTGVTRSPTQEIVYRDQIRYDYRRLAERVARLASGLTDLGVRQGNIVGVLDWDSHRYLESYFAVPGIGAILHTVNIRLSPEDILFTINHARDDTLLVHVDFLPMLEAVWDRLETVRTIIVLSDDGSVHATSLPIAAEYETLLERALPTFDFPDLDENSTATTFYTTGTTGLPKGVFFSHRQLVLHTLATIAALAASPTQGRLHRDDVYMPITPMFHVHAWGVPLVATMLGLKQVYPGRYAADTLLALRSSEKVTFSHCVPTLLHMLLTSPSSAQHDLSGWKIIIGGSALSKGLAEAALRRGVDVFAGYGMSETCPILTVAQVTTAQSDDHAVAVETRTRAGSPIPFVEIAVVDADMNLLPADGATSGEIVVRAPWLTRGYLGDANASDVLWAGGRLHTGDVGVLHPDGSVQITDRMKDVIKTGGEWISSLAIEDLLSRHPGVGDVAVIGVPDGRWGERPLAIVVPSGSHGAVVDEDALRSHLERFSDEGLIPRWAIPTRMILVDDLCRTSVGKPDKKALRARFGAA